ncbi:MAG: hypothetical protein U9O24_00855 [Campylobacterota bacterium]|nr:hypothetical protein [Campylobacterota bacterium]
MKKYIVLLLVGLGSANALDIRFGQGDFKWSSGISDNIKGSLTIEETVIAIHEQHKNITNTSWYYFGNLDIYSSKQLNKITNIADSIMDFFPLAPDDFITPFPSSFKLKGLDLDLGIGYDVIKNHKGYLGVGLMTGISTPFMEMNNYVDSLDAINTLLENTSTEVATYKFGLTAQAEYYINPVLSVYGTAIYATQTGEMSNELFNSSFDISGTYSSLNLGAKYSLKEILKNKNNFYINAGYSYKNWDIDDLKINFYGVDMPDIMTIISTEMSSNYFYLGAGYDF